MADRVAFSFQWPDGLTLDALRNSTRTARHAGDEKHTEHSSRFRLVATRRADGTHVDASFSDDPRATIVGARIPSVVLDARGDPLRVSNVDAIRALVANAFSPGSAEASAIEPLVSDAALLAGAQQEWRALVSRWHGQSLTVGVPLERTALDLVEGEPLDTTTTLTLLSFDATRGVARLQAKLRPNTTNALALQQKMLKAFSAQLKGAPKIDVQELKISTVIELETSAALIPTRLLMVQKSATVLEVRQGKSVETVTSSDESRDETTYTRVR